MRLVYRRRVVRVDALARAVDELAAVVVEVPGMVAEAVGEGFYAGVPHVVPGASAPGRAKARDAAREASLLAYPPRED